ncbi:MAG: hypothetical protein A2202_07395 [Bdellovibrionales bacterium RIFOXYA1_FULL_36_14]|nr:MAG: hypothetical protein A2202_07395 [Bdellovibrionales bacterium RIFOXYA1_FULL_36_14]
METIGTSLCISNIFKKLIDINKKKIKVKIASIIGIKLGLSGALVLFLLLGILYTLSTLFIDH